MREQILKDAQMIREIALIERDALKLKEQSIAKAVVVKKSVGARQLNWFGKYAPHKDIELLTGYKHFGHFVKDTDKPGFVYYLDENDKPLWIERYDDDPACKYALIDDVYFDYSSDDTTILKFDNKHRLIKVIRCRIDDNGNLDYYLEADIYFYLQGGIGFFRWDYNYVADGNVEILELKYSEYFNSFKANKWFVIDGKPSVPKPLTID